MENSPGTLALFNLCVKATRANYLCTLVYTPNDPNKPSRHAEDAWVWHTLLGDNDSNEDFYITGLSGSTFSQNSKDFVRIVSIDELPTFLHWPYKTPYLDQFLKGTQHHGTV